MDLKHSRRLRVVQELAFSANIAAGLLIVFQARATASLATSEADYTDSVDAGYYLLRATHRLTDVLHLPSVNPVSVETAARNLQSVWLYRDHILLLLVSLITATLLLTPLLRRFVTRVSGFAAAATAALCYNRLLPHWWLYPDGGPVVPVVILLLGVVVFIWKARPAPVASWQSPAALLSFVVLLLLYSPNLPRDIHVKDIHSLTMQFAGGPCFGACYTYKITIHGSGELEAFRSGDRSRPPIVKTASLSRAQIDSIIEKLNRAHYLNLSDRAFHWCFDTPSISVAVSWDGGGKTVVADSMCVGPKDGAQDRFVRAFYEIVKAVFPETLQR